MPRKLEEVFTPLLGRNVYLRPDTSDRQVWADTFTGLYHLPPEGMPEPRTVLDLGANIGLVAAHFRALWPDADILAVEMDSGNAALIEQNAPGVTILRVAVDLREHFVRYDIGVREEAYAVPERPSRAADAREVWARPLSDLAGFYIGHPSDDPGLGLGSEYGADFCKMDVEGMEWRLFADPDGPDGWARLVRHLVVELHDPGAPSEEIVARGIVALEELGFQARHHPPHPQAVYAWR